MSKFKIHDKITIKPWIKGYHKDYYCSVFEIWGITSDYVTTTDNHVFFIRDCILASECQELLYG